MFRARTAENVAIVVGLQWFNRVLGVVTKIILVRLLLPDVFGVFALAAGLISFIGTFGNFGLDYAIIQKGDKATAEDYDVGMSLRLVIAVGLFAASFLFAGPWAAIFGISLVGPATQVMALVYLVTTWSFVPATHLSSELRYRTIAVPNLAGQIVNSFLSVALALLGFGVWALVYGYLAAQVVTTIAYSMLRGWRFRFTLRREVARPLMGYAQHLVSASLLGFLITNIDNLTVGYFLKSSALGLYTVAYGFGYVPVSLLSTPAGTALFPSLTKIQGMEEKLRTGYLESFGYAAVLIVPTSVGMAVMGPEIVRVLFGSVWLEATIPLIILAFYGLGRAIVEFGSSLFAAVGQPRTIAILNLYILVGSIALLFPLTLTYGIAGTAVAMTVPVLLVAVQSMSRAAKVLRVTLRSFADKLRSPLVAAGLMGGVVLALRFGLYAALPARVELPLLGRSVSDASIVLGAGILLGVALYFALLRLLDPESVRGIWKHARMVLRRPV